MLGCPVLCRLHGAYGAWLEGAMACDACIVRRWRKSRLSAMQQVTHWDKGGGNVPGAFDPALPCVACPVASINPFRASRQGMREPGRSRAQPACYPGHGRRAPIGAGMPGDAWAPGAARSGWECAAQRRKSFTPQQYSSVRDACVSSDAARRWAQARAMHARGIEGAGAASPWASEIALLATAAARIPS